MSWFKTNVTYPTDCRWNVLQGRNANQPMLVRKNESAKVLKADGRYRARVGIAVKLLETTVDGFPSPRELSVLNDLEDTLATAFEAKHNAIHALTITTSGFREYVFYSKETVDLSTALGIVRAKFNSYELQSYAAEDADWRVYDEFG
jgi:hypothetical protein